MAVTVSAADMDALARHVLAILPEPFREHCTDVVLMVEDFATPEQLEAVVDNAFRTAIATSSPTCVIVPHDVQQAEVPATEHTHGIIPSAPVTAVPRILPDQDDLDRAAKVLNAGERVALLVGQGAHGAGTEIREVAERLVASGAAVVGIDSVNIDSTATGDRPIHSALLAAGVPIVEHLTDLGALTGRAFRFTAAPPAVVGMGPFPVRAVDVLDD